MYFDCSLSGHVHTSFTAISVNGLNYGTKTWVGSENETRRNDDLKTARKINIILLTKFNCAIKATGLRVVLNMRWVSTFAVNSPYTVHEGAGASAGPQCAFSSNMHSAFIQTIVSSNDLCHCALQEAVCFMCHNWKVRISLKKASTNNEYHVCLFVCLQAEMLMTLL